MDYTRTTSRERDVYRERKDPAKCEGDNDRASVLARECRFMELGVLRRLLETGKRQRNRSKREAAPC
jgi:hypothetical protein